MQIFLQFDEFFEKKFKALILCEFEIFFHPELVWTPGTSLGLLYRLRWWKMRLCKSSVLGHTNTWHDKLLDFRFHLKRKSQMQLQKHKKKFNLQIGLTSSKSVQAKVRIKCCTRMGKTSDLSSNCFNWGKPWVFTRCKRSTS